MKCMYFLSCILSYQGYVVIEDFFTHDELEPVKGALNTLVDNLAYKLYYAGKLRSMQ